MDNLLARIRLGEDSTLQLKPVLTHGASKVDGPHPDSLADELAAFGNAHGGTLILGVDDKSKDILGIPCAALDMVERWLAEICQTRIQPPLDTLRRPNIFGCTISQSGQTHGGGQDPLLGHRWNCHSTPRQPKLGPRG